MSIVLRLQKTAREWKKCGKQETATQRVLGRRTVQRTKHYKEQDTKCGGYEAASRTISKRVTDRSVMYKPLCII